VTTAGHLETWAVGQEKLAERLRVLGSRHTRLIIHRNTTVMLSLNRQGVLRLHEGYAFAPDRVLKAIVRFLNPRVPRPLRRLAEREFLAFPVQAHAPSPPGRPYRERAHPGDLRLLHRLETLHRERNARLFGGALDCIPIRLSNRMRTRLGELAVDMKSGRPLEIAMSRRHLTRHPWNEVEHTMLHEMVHQWQAQNWLPVDHGATFKRKARQVGVLPAAKRAVAKSRPVAQERSGMLVATGGSSGHESHLQAGIQLEVLKADCFAQDGC
jgi:SprT-like family